MNNPDQQLTTPPSLSTPSITGPSTTTPASSSSRKSRALLWWVVGGVVAIGIFGGGYFAYSRGFISIPFLTPKTDTLFTKMVDSISSISSAQYGVRTHLESQARDNSVQPLFDTTNKNINSLTLMPAGSLFGGLNPSTLFKEIPADVKIDGGVSVYYESGKSAKEANGKLTIDGTYSGSDLTVALDVELRKVQENLYAEVRKFPSLPFFDLSGIKQKWVKVTPDDSIADISTSTIENKDLQKNIDTLKTATKRALDTKLFTVNKRLSAETIAGVRTEHYELKMHPDKLSTFYTAIRDERKASNTNVADLDVVITQLKKPEVQSILQRVADNSKIEIWIDKTKGFLRQARWGLTVAPDASIERLKNKQLYLALTMTLEKVNEKVSVDTPSPTIDFDEATRLVTGVSKESQQYSKQIARVEKVKSALSLYKTKNNAYPDSLDQLNSSVKSLYTACIQKANETKTPQSSDSSAIARDATRKSDLAQLRTGLALYYDDHDSTYPTDLAALQPTYLATLPVDPSTKGQYSYTNCSAKHYVVGATLETTTEKYSTNDLGTTNQSSTPLACPTTTNTNVATSGGATSFSIESIGTQVGLGDVGGSYQCYTEKQFQNGVSFTDVYTGKPYVYTKTATDYTLEYQLKFAGDISTYEKESYVEGKNTATSTDDSTEKTSTYEQQLKDTPKKFNLNVNTSTAPITVQPAPPSDTNIPTDLKKDTDGDGLTDYQEVTIYRTKVDNKDTDGDGHDDKTEVEGQYNPLGAGAATAQQLLEWGVAPTVADGSPKVISSSISSMNGTLVVTITTDVPSDLVVNYGETTNYGGFLSDQSFSTTHTLSGGILKGHSYHVVPRVCAQAGPCYSAADTKIVGQ